MRQLIFLLGALLFAQPTQSQNPSVKDTVLYILIETGTYQKHNTKRPDRNIYKAKGIIKEYKAVSFNIRVGKGRELDFVSIDSIGSRNVPLQDLKGIKTTTPTQLSKFMSELDSIRRTVRLVEYRINPNVWYNDDGGLGGLYLSGLKEIYLEERQKGLRTVTITKVEWDGVVE